MSRLPVSNPVAIAVAAAAAAGLALVLAAPVLMDGEAWRGRIETEASALLGRKVTVAGPITLRVLPSPAVTLAAVAVENTAALDRVRLGLSLGALLAGRPELSDVAVEGGRAGPLDGLTLRASAVGDAFTLGGSGRLWGRPATLEASGRRPGGGEMAPLKATLALPSLESTAGFEGSFGKGGLDGKLELALASLSRTAGSGQLPDAPLSAQAELRLSPDEVVVSDLGVILGESTITGSVVASLTGAPALMDITLRADSFDLDGRRPTPAPVQAKAPAPAPPPAPATLPAQQPGPAPAASQPFELPHNLTANLDFGIGRLKWRGETVSNIQLNALLDGERLTLSQASARLPGGGAVKLTGALATPEGRPRFDGDLKAESRNLPALRSWLGLGGGAAPARGKLEGKVRLADNRLSLNALTLDLDERRVTGMVSAGLAWPVPLKAELGLPGLALGFDGSFADGRVEGGASLRAAGFAQAIRAVAPGYRPRGNGELSVSTRIDGKDGRIAFDDLQVRAGDAAVGGRASLSLDGQPKLVASLSGNAIALDPFLPAEGKDKAEEPKPRRRTGHAAPPPSVVPAAVSSGGSWSRTPLDLGWLQALDADLSLDAKAVTVSGWRLDQPRVHVGLSKGVADLDRISGRLLGGDLAAAARVAPNALTLSATLKGADLAQVKPASGGLRLEKGRMGAELRLAAAGTSAAALVSSLAGNGRIDVADGEVSGFDLAAMDSRMRTMENLGSLLGLVQAGLSGGSSRFSSLSGTFAADRGIVASRDLALVAEGGGATGIATVDLPRETVSSKIAFRLAAPDAPALGLRLEGPLASPVKAVDVNDLQRWLVQKGLGKALNPKGAGDNPDAPRKLKAGDALRGLFSAFGKKKTE